MAVYTQITPQQLSVFLAGYDQGELRDFTPIQEGVENSNFHVYTDKGRFILTLFEKRVRGEDLPFFFAFTEHLARHDVPCPQALTDKLGETVGEMAERPAALITFLEGTQISYDAITAGHCASLGHAIAGMHRAALSFHGHRQNTLSLPGWRVLAERTASRADEVETGLAGLIVKELDFLQRNWPQHLPECVVHADLFPDNVFFTDGQWSGFIDFYFSCTDFLAYDLALAVNAWCFGPEREWDSGRFQALLKGYESERPLTLIEKASFQILLRGAALRILLTRLHDWLFHDPAHYVVPKDPREYSHILRFHQHVRILKS